MLRKLSIRLPNLLSRQRATYSIEETVLVLERKEGGSLIFEVTSGGEGKFNFKLLGTDDEDPGLDFSR